VAQRNNIRDYLLELLASSEYPLEQEIQGLIVLGLSKLCLSNMLNDDAVLLMLWRAYLDPSTSTNQALRQNLAAFFTYYSHASKASQKHLCEVCIWKIYPTLLGIDLALLDFLGHFQSCLRNAKRN
jgi:condensin complex subunit 3